MRARLYNSCDFWVIFFAQNQLQKLRTISLDNDLNNCGQWTYGGYVYTSVGLGKVKLVPKPVMAVQLSKENESSWACVRDPAESRKVSKNHQLNYLAPVLSLSWTTGHLNEGHTDPWHTPAFTWPHNGKALSGTSRSHWVTSASLLDFFFNFLERYSFLFFEGSRILIWILSSCVPSEFKSSVTSVSLDTNKKLVIWFHVNLMYLHFNLMKFKFSKRLIVIWYDIGVEVPVDVSVAG